MAVEQDDARLIEALMNERQRLKQERGKNLRRNEQINKELKQLTYTSVAEKFDVDPSTVKRIDMGAW